MGTELLERVNNHNKEKKLKITLHFLIARAVGRALKHYIIVR